MMGYGFYGIDLDWYDPSVIRASVALKRYLTSRSWEPAPRETIPVGAVTLGKRPQYYRRLSTTWTGKNFKKEK